MCLYLCFSHIYVFVQLSLDYCMHNAIMAIPIENKFAWNMLLSKLNTIHINKDNKEEWLSLEVCVCVSLLKL